MKSINKNHLFSEEKEEKRNEWKNVEGWCRNWVIQRQGKEKENKKKMRMKIKVVDNNTANEKKCGH